MISMKPFSECDWIPTWMSQEVSKWTCYDLLTNGQVGHHLGEYVWNLFPGFFCTQIQANVALPRGRDESLAVHGCVDAWTAWQTAKGGGPTISTIIKLLNLHS